MRSIKCLAASFLSTLPARGATGQGVDLDDPVVISIHAPREGSDPGAFHVGGVAVPISIHAPREGSDKRPVSRVWTG